MIESHPSAPLGSVTTLTQYSASDFAPTSAILCRLTAPLISFAFQLIRRNIGCRVLGREIGTGLISIIDKMKCSDSDLDALSAKLAVYFDREVAKCESRDQLAAADALRDKHSCIELFISNLDESRRTISALRDKITTLFDDTNKGLLTLATVHKSKGLEWPTVFILDRDKYMPSKFARLPWQRQQEYNLIYVAITRAKLDLRYIESGTWTAARPLPPTTSTSSPSELLASI